MEFDSRVPFHRVRDFSGVISATTAFLRENFKPLGKTLLMTAGPFLLGAGIMNGFTMSGALMEDFGTMGGASMLGFFLSLAGSVIAIAALYGYMKLYDQRGYGAFDVSDVWAEIRAMFWPFVLIGILYAIAVMIGGLLFIIPGIYLAIAFSLVYAVYQFEGGGIGSAFSESRELVKGYWWQTLGILFVMSIAAYVFVMAMMIPYYVVIFMSAFAMEESGSLDMGLGMRLAFMLASIVGSLAGLATVLPSTATAFQYFNLVERKEAPDLESRISAMGEERV